MISKRLCGFMSKRYVTVFPLVEIDVTLTTLMSVGRSVQAWRERVGVVAQPKNFSFVSAALSRTAVAVGDIHMYVRTPQLVSWRFLRLVVGYYNFLRPDPTYSDRKIALFVSLSFSATHTPKSF